MSITSARYVYGLQATGVPTSTNVTGNVQIGVSQQDTTLPTATIGYSVGMVFYDTGESVTIDATTGDATPSGSHVTGVAQVETATAAGTVTGSGNATVVITSAAVTGSPLTVSVPVLVGDTASQWADKVRIALGTYSAITDKFTISGSTTAIVLTRKSTTIATGFPVAYAANDSTLNISLANGTCTGITNATSSANTTAGVATSGAYVLDGDGKDFEGATLATLTEVDGLLVQASTGPVILTTALTTAAIAIPSDSIALFAGSSGLGENYAEDITITAGSSAFVKLTIIGE